MRHRLIPVTLTLKFRLYLASQQAKPLDLLMNDYAKACSYTSKRKFDAKNNMGVVKLHNLVYYPIRHLFHLKAQEACSVPKTVIARYTSVNTQLYESSHKRYKDVYTGKHFYLDKNIHDLWNPIHFNTPQADLVYKNDWRFIPSKHRISINTPHGYKHVVAKYYLPKWYRQYLGMDNQLGTAKLIKRGGHHYLYASCTVFVKNHKQLKKLIGSDRGIRFIDCPYDGHHFIHVVKGLSIRKKRTHFLHRRAVLQHKHTESAKRKLKQMSGRENSWMATKNHQFVKTLVSGKYDIVYSLENLDGVRFANKDVKKRYKYGQVSWAFYQFGFDLGYKAKLYRSYAIEIPKQYTSQRCPKCGYVCAESRKHGRHIFICMNPNCNYQGNDDFTASKNIRFLGILELAGYKHPTIQKDSRISYRIYYKSNKRKYRTKYLQPSQAIRLAQASHVTNR